MGLETLDLYFDNFSYCKLDNIIFLQKFDNKQITSYSDSNKKF